jgi:hypothetical protein
LAAAGRRGNAQVSQGDDAVPHLSDFLTRFRPVGTPGAAALRGVPADRVTEREAELRPVLALLVETQREGDRIRREAAEQAEQRRLRARRQAESILTEARGRAAAERAQAAARVTPLVADERRHAEAEAASRAAQVRAAATQRIPELVDKALAPVLAAALDPSPVVAVEDASAPGRRHRKRG